MVPSSIIHHLPKQHHIQIKTFDIFNDVQQQKLTQHEAIFWLIYKYQKRRPNNRTDIFPQWTPFNFFSIYALFIWIEFLYPFLKKKKKP